MSANKPDVPPEKISGDKRDSKPTSASPPVLPEKAKPRALFLPKGALMAFRKTRGAITVEFFLYPDGRISFNTPDYSKEAHEHVARKLNDAQINRLRHLLDQVNFYRTPSAQGKASPEGISYEISARVGSKANAVELFEGSIPGALKPLIEQLNALMPKEGGEEKN